MLNLLNRHPLHVLREELRAHQPEHYERKEHSWSPRVDISEAQDKFILVADIPGIGPEDIEIEVEEDILTLKGKREIETEGGFTKLRGERFSGSFSRAFRLSQCIAKDEISAEVKHGVIRLVLPKATPVLPTSVTVNFH